MRKTILIPVITILLLGITSASYISGDIYIYENGQTKFNVETDISLDIPDLIFSNNELTGRTDFLTSKSGRTWTFSINQNTYDTILLDIHLPSNLNSITSIQGNTNIIDVSDETITIIDSGELNFEISYELEESANIGWLIWPLIIILLIVGFFIYNKKRKSRDRLQNILPLINEHEQKIIDILMKGPIRQKEIRKSLGIPKASFSRYMVNLEKKKLIFREGEGKNKIIKLK